MRDPLGTVMGRPRRPMPGHPYYRVMQYVPYEQRTPSHRPGGYEGEVMAAIRRAHHAVASAAGKVVATLRDAA